MTMTRIGRRAYLTSDASGHGRLRAGRAERSSRGRSPRRRAGSGRALRMILRLVRSCSIRWRSLGKSRRGITTVTSVPVLGQAQDVLLERARRRCGPSTRPRRAGWAGAGVIHSSASAAARSGSTRGVDGADLVRAQRQRVADGAEGGAVQLVDQHDRRVGPRGGEADDRLSVGALRQADARRPGWSRTSVTRTCS